MNEHNKVSQERQPASGQKWTTVLLGLAALLTIPFATFWLTTDHVLDRGELILSERGCQVMRHHGVDVKPLSDSGLCAVRAEFRFTTSSERFGRIKLVRGEETLEIVMSGREIVSQVAF